MRRDDDRDVGGVESLLRQEFLDGRRNTTRVEVGEVGVAVDLQAAPPIPLLGVGGERPAVLRVVLKHEAAEALRIVASAEQDRRAGLADAGARVAAFGAVVFYLRGHDQGMFGLSRPDHSRGDLTGVQEADRTVEDVEGERFGPVRGVDIAVDSEFPGDERGYRRFAEKVLAVDAGVDDQTDRRPVKAGAVQARGCRGGREPYRARRGRLPVGSEGHAVDPHAGRRR